MPWLWGYGGDLPSLGSLDTSLVGKMSAWISQNHMIHSVVKFQSSEHSVRLDLLYTFHFSFQEITQCTMWNYYHSQLDLSHLKNRKQSMMKFFFKWKIVVAHFEEKKEHTHQE